MDSPAKINLNLRILGKRPDGFHELETLMVKLPGLSDKISITRALEFSFSCSDVSLPVDGGNLVVKATQALSKKSGEDLPFRIHLEKNIPHGAGLGGGSSNAATALIALNKELISPLPDTELHAIAAELGSDIPFFLTPGAAICSGRGEIVTPCENPDPMTIVLFKPGFAVSTADAYKNCLGAVPVPGIDYNAQTFNDLTLINDLEKPVFAKHRYLAELKNWLFGCRDVKAAMMSGSGSTIYAILDEKADPTGLINYTRRRFDSNLWTWSGRICAD